MSISKEEREHYKAHANSISENAIAVPTDKFRALLDDLDTADERIGELQAENERLQRELEDRKMRELTR